MKNDKFCFNRTLAYLVLLILVVIGFFKVMDVANKSKKTSETSAGFNVFDNADATCRNLKNNVGESISGKNDYCVFKDTNKIPLRIWSLRSNYPSQYQKAQNCLGTINYNAQCGEISRTVQWGYCCRVSNLREDKGSTVPTTRPTKVPTSAVRPTAIVWPNQPTSKLTPTSIPVLTLTTDQEFRNWAIDYCKQKYGINNGDGTYSYKYAREYKNNTYKCYEIASLPVMPNDCVNYQCVSCVNKVVASVNCGRTAFSCPPTSTTDSRVVIQSQLIAAGNAMTKDSGKWTFTSVVDGKTIDYSKVLSKAYVFKDTRGKACRMVAGKVEAARTYDDDPTIVFGVCGYADVSLNYCWCARPSTYGGLGCDKVKTWLKSGQFTNVD